MEWVGDENQDTTEVELIKPSKQGGRVVTGD